jgi:hypothetical protein
MSLVARAVVLVLLLLGLVVLVGPALPEGATGAGYWDDGTKGMTGCRCSGEPSTLPRGDLGPAPDAGQHRGQRGFTMS